MISTTHTQHPTIELVKVEESDKSVLRQLLELYAHDFSEYDCEDVNEQGLYRYPYFDHYWIDKTRTPLFIRVNGKLGGFVLINEFSYLENTGIKSVAEFFIMRKYRRQGIGKIVARKIFKMFPGKWEVVQHINNLPSIKFWKNIISELTDGNFHVQDIRTETWPGQAILFDNSTG